MFLAIIMLKVKYLFYDTTKYIRYISSQTRYIIGQVNINFEPCFKFEDVASKIQNVNY
jgi:hypothetical protein